MTAENGRANGSAIDNESELVVQTPVLPDMVKHSTGRQFSANWIKQSTAELEVPFDPAVIEWRVTNTTKSGKLQGRVIPYADPRAYTDRLNSLFTPGGWTRKYANFQRTADQKTVAKVFVTCELTIFGLGSHSATGEEWTDDDNAGTSGEAQAFKRACACFGLGRYLYDFDGVWVDLDERKRPRTALKLLGWATPEGWRQGLRPEQREKSSPDLEPSADRRPKQGSEGDRVKTSLVGQIEAMAKPLGCGLYRGLLKRVARVWNPGQIKDGAVLKKVLDHMQAAERGLRRLETALDKVGLEALVPMLQSFGFHSIEQIDDLKTLHQIVVATEAKAGLANTPQKTH